MTDEILTGFMNKSHFITDYILLNEKIKKTEISFELQESKHESGKPMQIMKVEGYKSCPCGGTHVKSMLEIGQIKIRKIKNNKGNIKISYQIMA